MEKQIQSERMKVELITNVSHDLKTPLTSIISYVELLKEEEGGGYSERSTGLCKSFVVQSGAAWRNDTGCV